MNIVYATSDLYSRPALISIKSLLANNIRANEINIYYVENGLSEQNKRLISELVSSYGRIIEFIKMPDYLKNIDGLMRTNPIVYSYCFFQDILPLKIEKVLLLEGDSIVVNDIQEYFDLPIDDYYLAATDDFQSKWYKRILGMKETSVYFNSGIMLFNLKKIRKDGITQKITNLIEGGKSKFFYEVQDEMNVLFENEILVLPPRFNATTSVFLFNYKNMIRYRQPSTCCTKNEFEEARNNPLVVHFTKNQIIQSRPWVVDCKHEYNEYYLNLKKETALKDEPLWYENRKLANKLAYCLYKSVFKSVMAWGLGYIHGVVYPISMYLRKKRSVEK